MDKFIAVPINLFTLEQQIMICDDNNSKEFARVELAKLPEVIADLAYTQKIENVKLVGNKSYASAIESELKNYIVSNYAQHTLNIEILEG